MSEGDSIFRTSDACTSDACTSDACTSDARKCIRSSRCRSSCRTPIDLAGGGALGLVLLGFSLLAASCGPSGTAAPDENLPPRIEAVAAFPTQVSLGREVILEIVARDPEQQPLTLAWTATSGTLSDPSSARTGYISDSSGAVTVTCAATDPGGLSTSLALLLSVVAPPVDLDGDGHSASAGDCEDLDPLTYPQAPELLDGRDNDCDGQVDEGLGVEDLDDDGYSPARGDCDDADPTAYPAAQETPNGRDDDCDGLVDEGSSAADDDRDDFSEDEGDCDDARPDAYPGAVELPDGIDNDCDGSFDEETILQDDDGDGFTELQGDCRDDLPSVGPHGEELPNAIDDNCDGWVDEGTPDQDLDGDGISLGEGDCDDLRADVAPGLPERADGLDNDCDGAIDEETEVYDDDGDGITEISGDCNDQDFSIAPGLEESPDGEDNDCDGLVDEGTELSDDDGDGITELAGDCADDDVRRRPGYPEVPDGLDNDCDGTRDEDTWLVDADADGFSIRDGDCDDTDAFSYPGATELPGDGILNDCTDVPAPLPPVARGEVRGASPGCSSLLLSSAGSFDPEGQALQFQWYLIDGPLEARAAPARISHASSGEAELSWTVEGLYRIGLAVRDGHLTGDEQILLVDIAALRLSYCDLDQDGDGIPVGSGDCNDLDPTVYPGATELCDGIDQDCDGREILFVERFDRFDAERWLLSGHATAEPGLVLLTDAVRNQTGSIFYRMPLSLSHFTIRFEFLMSEGSSGNGLTFAVLDESTSTFLGEGGGGNGLLGLPGWGVEFDTNRDSSYDLETSTDHIAIVWAEDLSAAATYPRAVLRTNPMSIEIRVQDGEVEVVSNSVPVLSVVPDWSLPERGFIGFTAATGQDTDRHQVLEVSFECGSW